MSSGRPVKSGRVLKVHLMIDIVLFAVEHSPSRIVQVRKERSNKDFMTKSMPSYNQH